MPALHPEAFRLLQELKGPLLELAVPVEEVQKSHWRPGDDKPDGLGSLLALLHVICVSLAHSDGDISVEEASFIHDVLNYFNPEYDAENVWGMEEFRRHLMRAVAEQPDLYDAPGVAIVEALEAYDGAAGTDYADKARTLVFRFANAIVKADGHVNGAEEAALARLKSALFKTKAVEAGRAAKGAAGARPLIEADRPLEESLEELNSLVGLAAVKNALFSVLYDTRDETFGNGRLARNLFEVAISNQANRIVSMPEIDEESLTTIEEIDIPGMVDLHSLR
jgi:hypothetical protein